MKTPRDLLLERHRQRSPALDRLRERVIAQELGAGTEMIRQARTAPARDRLPACPALLARWFTWLNWRRAAWSGFAALWCVILGLNLAAEHEMGTGAAASAPIDPAQFFAGLQENRAHLAALLSHLENENQSTDRKPEPGSRSDAGRIRQRARHLNPALV
jgi:hypothetical protein